METVQIQSAGRVLCGTLFTVPNAEVVRAPAVLLIHGWQSAQDRMFDTAEMLREKLGYLCLTVDLGGHGKSEGVIGELSRKDYLDDVVAAYDFLAAQPGVDASRIGVLGSSFGGYLASLLSSKRNVTWMVLRVPADYPDERFEFPKVPSSTDEKVGENDWRVQKRNWNDTATLRAVHDFHGKVLIVESEKDEIVPRQTLQNYADAVSEKNNMSYVVMKDAPHSLTKHPELKKAFNEIVFEWKQEK